jgi:hypothetical protein
MKQTTEYKNKFKTEHYDSINLNIAKGTKSELQEYLKNTPLSLSGFIKEAIADKYEKETGIRLIL